jgi:transglutaminase-like putative cysteine protease
MKTITLAAGLMLSASLPALAQLELPARIQKSTRTIDLAADGTSTITSHIETKILTQAGISLLGQTKLNFREQLETLDIVQAYTLKPDGTKVMVKPEAIIVQQAPASSSAAIMDDTKQKVIIYPNLEIGDVLVQDTVAHLKPIMPGNFMYDTIFPAALSIEDATTTITAPKSLALQVDNYKLDVARSEDGDRQVLTRHFSQPKADLKAWGQSGFDIAPRLSLSTFKTWDDFAREYGQEATAAAEVTPAIKAKADEVTAKTRDRREQAHKLYDWVSAHVRYVGLEFGRGGIVPHKAEDVMSNGYGDCKDHAVLYLALLKARGIPANLVAINGTDGHTVAKVPTISPFNHMIVWIPEFRMFADTTAGRLTPFGYLPPSEYGKPVMVVGAPVALQQVPESDGKGWSVNYKQTAVSDEAGHITSTSELTAKGGFVLPLRALGQVAQGQDAAKLAEALLKKSSTPRATGALTLPPPGDATDSYQMTANYTTPGVQRYLIDGDRVGMHDSLRPLSPFSSAFFGPLIADSKGDAVAGPCYNGHAVDDETLQYPAASRKLTKLPADSKLDSAHVTYSAHWTAGSGSITVHRELTTHFDHSFCTGAERGEMTALAERLRDDLDVTFGLPRDAKGATKPEE